MKKHFFYVLLIAIIVYIMAFIWCSDTKDARVNVLEVIPNYQNETGKFAKGPNGENAVSADTINLTKDQYQVIRNKNLTVALLWAGSGEWYNAITDGAKSEFQKMGVEIVVISDAGFDPAKQATDIETAMALNPSIILTLPVYPISGTRAYQPAVDAGVKIVFADNGVDNYESGNQYVAIVTGDQYGMGRAAAKQIADAIGGKGKTAVIYYESNFLVTNNRDNEFVRTIVKEYPEIEIVAIKGFSEESSTGEIASSILTQYPDVDGVFVSWDVAAEPVVAELRTVGMKNSKLVTFDLGGNNDLDMAQDGNVYAKVADMPYQIGKTMAKAAALSILNEQVPPYIVSGVVEMTRDNMIEAWQESLNKKPAVEVLQMLQQ